jgi:replicative DNA helicase
MDKLNDPGLERAVLSGIAHNQDTFLDVESILSPNTFVDDINQVVFKAVKEIRANNDAVMDKTLLLNTINQLGYREISVDPENREYISRILELTVQPANVRKFAATIRKYEIARLLDNQLEDAQQTIRNIKGNERVDEIIAIAENKIFDFSSLLADNDKSSSYIHISDGALEYYEHLVSNPRDLLGISSGYPNYDIALGGGLQRKNVNIIAARTGVGKSMMADNMSLHIAGVLKIPVLYLDTEMDEEGHWFRLWANISGVEMNDIKTGKCGKNEYKDRKVRKAIEYVNQVPYYYQNISGKPFEEILAFVRRWLVKEVGVDANGKMKDCVIFHDYLKLMSNDNISDSMKEYQVLGFQMTGMHNFTVRHDIPISSFIQLNKDGITKEGLEGISQSDRISWLASSVAIYKVKSELEMAKTAREGNRKLIVVKSRHGSGHEYNQYINMKFSGAIAKITEGKLSSEVVEEDDDDDADFSE